MIDRRLFGLGALAAPLAASGPVLAAAVAGRRPGPFMLGADVTWIGEDEAAGAEYYVDGAQAVEAYTRDTLGALKSAGATADMVVIGNETTFGMLWPEGRVPLTLPTGNPVTDASHRAVTGAGGYDGFATLLKAGVAGARAADPTVKIQVHNHLGRHWPIVSAWMDALLARDVRFDVLGLSCYQQAAEGDWERTLTEFARRYPRHGVLVAEYSSRKRYINDLVRAVPGQRGWGAFIWEPIRHQEAIFDRNGKSAGEGPRPNLIAQGLNAAEAPGATPPRVAPPPPPVAGVPRRRTIGVGGRYDANALLADYRRMARDYGLK